MRKITNLEELGQEANYMWVYETKDKSKIAEELNKYLEPGLGKLTPELVDILMKFTDTFKDVHVKK